MAEPRWVISMGRAPTARLLPLFLFGGARCDRIVPVDIYVLAAATAEALLSALSSCRTRSAVPTPLPADWCHDCDP